MPNKCQKNMFTQLITRDNINTLRKTFKTDKRKYKMQKFKLLTGNNHLNQYMCDS